MNIGQITKEYFPRGGGIESHTEILRTEMRARGHSVSVFTTEDTPLPPNMKDLPNVTRIPHKKNLLWKWRINKPLGEFYKDKQIIHAHGLNFLSARASYLARRKRIPFFVTLHTTGGWTKRSFRPKIFIKKAREQCLAYLIMRRAHRVIAVSKIVQLWAMRYTKSEKICIIPYGIDTTKFNPRYEPSPDIKNKFAGKKVVLMTTRIVWYKGIQYLIMASLAIIRAVPDVQFVIIGDGPTKTHLETMAKKLGVAEYFVFTGHLPYTEIPHYLSIASLFAVLSHSETGSLSCMEAMAMGKTVVGSNITALEKLLGDNTRGFVVNMFEDASDEKFRPLEKDAVESLSQAIVNLLDAPNIRAELGARASRYISENHTLTLMTDRILNEYDRAMKNSSKNET